MASGRNGIDEIVAAINTTGVAEVVKSGEGPLQVKITHRVQVKQLKVWLGILTYVLTHKSGWDAHVCKQYFMRGGKLLYAWNFIIQWETGGKRADILKQVAALIARGNVEVPRYAGAVDSYPLMAKDGRNEPGGPMNVRAAGPMSGGYRQRGAHKL